MRSLSELSLSDLCEAVDLLLAKKYGIQRTRLKEKALNRVAPHELIETFGLEIETHPNGRLKNMKAVIYTEPILDVDSNHR